MLVEQIPQVFVMYNPYPSRMLHWGMLLKLLCLTMAHPLAHALETELLKQG